MLFDGNEPLFPLTPEKINALVREGYIEFPDITQREIRDRSKGDVLSKSLVILQTGWFVVQCMARGVEHLPITELELVTVAFATLNFVTYLFWWNKPLNVERPFRVLLKKPMADRQTGHGERREDITDWVVWILSVVTGDEDDAVDLTMEERVPTFYAGVLSNRQRILAAFGAAIIAMIFGGIHCIAWSFTFPTLVERLLWRVSSIAITGVPFFYVALFVLFSIFDHFRVDPSEQMREIIFISMFPSTLLFYVVARLMLLAQAFVTLRSLPSGVFQTVHWTNSIPHL